MSADRDPFLMLFKQTIHSRGDDTGYSYPFGLILIIPQAHQLI
jgi:hypothetical protein